MTKIIKTTFKLRRGTTEAWERNNPILAYGEPGFDKDKYGIKIGDGVTPWNKLNFLGASREEIREIVEEYVGEGIDIDVATDDEIIDMLIKEDMLPTVADTDGAILSDEDGNILLW